ncbi:DUF423 domain-containing protein [Rubripirellula sp.]|nr:DUF423 domain-containing protein [Rubripirellula sp.]MDF1839846.1 DUF423 domain-containing protein [Rubripirellula sp.]
MKESERIARAILLWAGISGAIGVILGSFGAHGLDAFLLERGYDADLVIKRVGQWDVGVRYQLIHSVALFALAAVPFGSDGNRRWVARLMLAGLLFFSGSLYLLVLTNLTILGAVAPLGGLSWIIAWLLLTRMAVT